VKAYLLSLVGAALVAALVNILTPSGERGGIAAHQRLITSLFLVCVLIAPLEGAIKALRGLANGDLTGILQVTPPDQGEFGEQLNEALDSSSRQYFTQMLTQTVSEAFAIPLDEIRCTVSWEESEQAPARVTVILSGRSIWKDPHAVADFVEQLLGCPCDTAIE
jgi:hypothetical protein